MRNNFPISRGEEDQSFTNLRNPEICGVIEVEISCIAAVLELPEDVEQLAFWPFFSAKGEVVLGPFRQSAARHQLPYRFVQYAPPVFNHSIVNVPTIIRIAHSPDVLRCVRNTLLSELGCNVIVTPHHHAEDVV